MAGVLILVFAGFGLIGIVLGIWAWRYVSRSTARSPHGRWKWIRVAAVVVGLALGAASTFLDGVFGYPISTPEGPGRIVGWPFLEAFFDAQGSDYVGLVTYVGAFANLVFWFLVPQLFLAAYARRTHRRHGF
jgi:hypothetical protein